MRYPRYSTYDSGDEMPTTSTRLGAMAASSIASTWTTDLGADFLLSSIASTWLDTICTFDEPGFCGLLSFTDDADGGDDDAGTLADTTRTTLDSCFVVLATGFVGLISDFSAVTSDVGFVSTTDVVDIGAVSGILLAFGGSVSNKLIIITAIKVSTLSNWLSFLL